MLRKTKDRYSETVRQLKEVDRQIRCLDACFRVISEPQLLDAVNYQLLSLKTKRSYLQNEVCSLYKKEELSEK